MWVTAIEALLAQEDFWALMVNSQCESGPFDGGCLVFAEGLKEARGRGQLVGLYNNRKMAFDHVGLRLDGIIYDGAGSHGSDPDWVRSFAMLENQDANELTVIDYSEQENCITRDPECSKNIALMIKNLI